MDRVILHCDCNSFFASVETVLNPSYRNVPMAVCGSEDDRHGIVLAKNELAKAYGIKTAETVYSARKKCSNLVVAKPHYEAYRDFSRRANEIYHRYTDMVEPFGIDESWLDVTASRKLFGTGREIAEKISSDIKRELGITVSVGVSFNKVFAKLGSDYKKPDAITEITRDNVKDIVYPLPASSLLFVGARTAQALNSIGVRTIGELAECAEEYLISKLGKAGQMLYKYARGLDDSPVDPTTREEIKSISNGFTFRHDLIGFDACRVGIEFLVEEIGTKLRTRGLKCCTVQLTIKDDRLTTIQRQCPMDPPTDISDEIAEVACRILREAWVLDKPVRMITVTAANLISADGYTPQISFFDDNDESQRIKKYKKEETIDKIRQKYGQTAIIKGAVIDTDIGIYTAPSKNDVKVK